LTEEFWQGEDKEDKTEYLLDQAKDLPPGLEVNVIYQFKLKK
jgi:hypothetical protein